MKTLPSFVISAIVASELHRAMLIAQDISLTAGNARALALRAGQGAAGFRAITEFIEDLANTTINFADRINSQAIGISKMASEIARLETTRQSFDRCFQLASDAEHIGSLNKAHQRVNSEYQQMQDTFNKKVKLLSSELEELKRELRTASVLAAMSRVEASQAGKANEAPLTGIAKSVAQAAEHIQKHVLHSQHLFQSFR